MGNDEELETTVALFRKDLDNFAQLFAKLDNTVSKISDVSNDISKLLALHEQRIETLHQNDRILEIKMEKNIGGFAEDMKELHHHIRNNNRDLADKFKSSEDSIKSEIKFIKELIDRENKGIRDTIEATNKEIKANQDRIVALERWRWVVVGGMTVIVWALNKSEKILSILV